MNREGDAKNFEQSKAGVSQDSENGRGMKQVEDVVEIIKGIIDKEGLKYIERDPYAVYEKLIAEKVDPSYARIVLVTLLSGTPTKAKKLDKEFLSKEIQKDCYLKKSMADRLAAMYKTIFDRKNLSVWSKKRLSGFKEFCENAWSFNWNGSREWHRNGEYVTCSADVDADYNVINREKMKKALGDVLKKNPFVTSEAIGKELAKELEKRLEGDLESYVDEDDYYEPWMEDYDCTNILEQFADDYGLELEWYDCSGDTSDWTLEGRW